MGFEHKTVGISAVQPGVGAGPAVAVAGGLAGFTGNDVHSPVAAGAVLLAVALDKIPVGLIRDDDEDRGAWVGRIMGRAIAGLRHVARRVGRDLEAGDASGAHGDAA